MFNSDDRTGAGMGSRVSRSDKIANYQPVTRQDGEQPKKNFKRILEDKPETPEEIVGDAKGDIAIPFTTSPLFNLIDTGNPENALGVHDFPQEKEALASLGNLSKQAGNILIPNQLSKAISKVSDETGPQINSIFGLSSSSKSKALSKKADTLPLASVKETEIALPMNNIQQKDMLTSLEDSSGKTASMMKLKDEEKMDVNLNAGLQSTIAALSQSANQNPIVGAQGIGTQETAPQTRIAELKSIIDAIVKSITTITQSGKTETVVALKNSPLFDGATIRLTTHDTAPGQYNVTFGNLKPDALNLIQQRQMDGSLETTLAQQGYTVHIVVATSQQDDVILAQQSQQSDEQNRNAKGEQQKQKQNKDEEEA